MPRILLLIVLLWILYAAVKHLMNQHQSNNRTDQKTKQAEKVVACSQCGLHIPENESTVVDGLTVCHAEACQKTKI